MTHTSTRSAMSRRWAGATGALMLGLLTACGGGGGDGRGDPGVVSNCTSPTARKQWLQDYFQGSLSVLPQYFWYRSSPNPAPAGFVDEADYFNALLYTGGDPNFTAADRWSNAESTAEFTRFFGDGQTLGYGVSVAGLEVSGNRNAPLYVRIVDLGSPAASAGVARGDQVVSIGPYSAAEIIDQVTADNFTILSPAVANTAVRMVLRKPAGTTVTVDLTSAVYALTPVSDAKVVTNASGRRIGYVFVRNMVSQAQSGMASAFASFRANGVQDLVVDLRYNGGGVIDIGRQLASYIGGTQDNNKVYARLLFNDQNQGKNTDTLFQALGSSLDMGRVYVLAGERTCSAAEQVVNGLRGIGMPVTVVGNTSCGKPVGFVPQSDGCGTTYNVVNFESVNALNQGRYFNGIVADCPVAENFQTPIGGNADPLFNAARLMADGSACAAAGGGLATVQSATGGEGGSAQRRRPRPGADGERAGMFSR
ncbi:periplasmic protease [Burkholderiales bacterium JOSHI_001]|nr:periplasmic protease [Burkholderiales bacterium JOSHI_001]